MHKKVAKWLGFGSLALGILGLFIGEGLFIRMLNMDLAFDGLRLALGGLLLWAVYGSRDAGVINASLLITGLALLGISAVSVVSPTIFGLLPSEFTGVDILIYSFAGVTALGILATPGRGVYTAVR